MRRFFEPPTIDRVLLTTQLSTRNPLGYTIGCDSRSPKKLKAAADARPGLRDSVAVPILNSSAKFLMQIEPSRISPGNVECFRMRALPLLRNLVWYIVVYRPKSFLCISTPGQTVVMARKPTMVHQQYQQALAASLCIYLIP